ncbi:hypothetical protein [uncultured Sulfitobacter sp.]|uniref:hypothetical protein n=1 Tax=uncultured Sulfitobacter sp. TaxID=191468 RepID=UPI0026034E69|nr:hypothetical protein [uncultured Sulfitobacter sp.]
MIEAKAALAIAETVLEKTRAAMQQGDSETFISFFNSPQRFETLSGDFLVRDVAGMREQIKQVCAENARLGVTRIKRTCIEAFSKSPNEIDCVYSTSLYAGDLLARAPHTTYITLGLIDDAWKILYTMYGAEPSESTTDALLRRAAAKPMLTLV